MACVEPSYRSVSSIQLEMRVSSCQTACCSGRITRIGHTVGIGVRREGDLGVGQQNDFYPTRGVIGMGRSTRCKQLKAAAPRWIAPDRGLSPFACTVLDLPIILYAVLLPEGASSLGGAKRFEGHRGLR